jgi:hypothetical protein
MMNTTEYLKLQKEKYEYRQMIKGDGVMNLIELDKQIKEHKIIEAIKDGIADGLLHGERDDTKTHHYYKIGYDYGCVMFDMLGTDVCRTKINDKEIA